MDQAKVIYQSLGAAKAAAVPGLHAFSGADNTGSFSGKGKLTCWKVFNTGDGDVITAFTNLAVAEESDEATMNGLEKFVCQLYQPTTSICQVNELKWYLFKKKQAQSETPTNSRRFTPSHFTRTLSMYDMEQ